MKKKVAILLTLILIVCSVVACGTTDKDKDSENKETNQNVENNEVSEGGDSSLSWEEIKAQIPEELKGTTVTIYSWNQMNHVQGAPLVIQQFEEETGINVEWIYGEYFDYATKLAGMVANDEAPDIVRLRDADPAVMKYLMPLEDVDYDFTDQAWNHDLMYHYQMNGKHYAAILKDSPYYQPMITYYNRTLIQKYGLEDPYELWKNGEWTWDKMMEMIEDFLAKAGSQYNGLSMFSGEDYCSSLGVSLVSYEPDANQYVSHMSDTNLVKGWQFTAKNIQRGLVMRQEYCHEAFEAGTVLFLNDSSIDARNGHWYFATLMDEGALGTVPVPAVEGQETYYYNLNENEAYGIPKGSKNAEAAAYFLRYYLDSENYDMSSFYCDEQAYEVVEWHRDKTFVTNVHQRIYKEQYGEGRTEIMYALRNSDPAQIKTHLDSYSPVIDAMVAASNKMISELEQ